MTPASLSDVLPAAALRRRRLRTGAVLLGVAALAGGPAQMLHPTPSPDDAWSFAPVVAASGAWTALHLLALASYTLASGGIYLLLLGYRDTRADVFGRLGSAALAVGLAVGTVWMASDGIATKALVDVWAAAGPDQAEGLLAASRALEELDLALFFLGMVMIFGLPFLLASAGMLLLREFPRWLGALGVVAATATAVVGLVQAFTGRTLLWTHVLTPVTVVAVSVWSVLTAVAMWRLAGAATDQPADVDRSLAA